MAEGIILVMPSDNPSGLALGQHGDMLEILSPCCFRLVEYDVEYEGDGEEAPLIGVSDGPALVFCPCGKIYKGYSNPIAELRTEDSKYLADSWLSPWLGIPTGEIELEITGLDE